MTLKSKVVDLGQTVAKKLLYYSAEDPAEARRGKLLSVITLGFAMLMFLLMSFFLFANPQASLQQNFDKLAFPFSFLLIYALVRAGYLQLAGSLTVFTAALTGLAGLPPFLVGVVLAYSIVLAGLVLGHLWMFVIALCVSPLPYFAGYAGKDIAPLPMVLGTTMVNLLLAITVYSLLREVRVGTRQSQTQMILEHAKRDLERRVTIRTQALQISFSLTEQFSRIALEADNLSTLLQQTGQLIEASFDFEVVHIYVENQNFVELVLSYGFIHNPAQEVEPGKLLPSALQEITRLQVISRQGQPHMAELFARPEIEAGVVIPLQKGAEKIGLLFVQTTDMESLNEATQGLLSELATQLTVAIFNLQRFAETETTLSQLEALNRQLMQQKWENTLKQRQVTGYIYTPSDTKAVTSGKGEEREAAWLPSMKGALKGDVAQTNNMAAKEKSADIAIPIKLRGETIGVIGLQREQHAWTKDEQQALHAVVEQIGLALESARLFEDTQRNAWRDQLISESTAEVWASNQIEAVMQAAVQELGRRLDASEVVLELDPTLELSEDLPV